MSEKAHSPRTQSPRPQTPEPPKESDVLAVLRAISASPPADPDTPSHATEKAAYLSSTKCRAEAVLADEKRKRKRRPLVVLRDLSKRLADGVIATRSPIWGMVGLREDYSDTEEKAKEAEEVEGEEGKGTEEEGGAEEGGQGEEGGEGESGGDEA